jgi:hypothetical protein
MGRFAPKYPPEAKAELYRLVLDADPRRTIREALAEIAETGIEINEETAKAYVRDEKAPAPVRDLGPVR